MWIGHDGNAEGTDRPKQWMIFPMTQLGYVSCWFQKVPRGSHTGKTCSLIHTVLTFFTVLNKLYL